MTTKGSSRISIFTIVKHIMAVQKKFLIFEFTAKTMANYYNKVLKSSIVELYQLITQTHLKVQLVLDFKIVKFQ